MSIRSVISGTQAVGTVEQGGVALRRPEAHVAPTPTAGRFSPRVALPQAVASRLRAMTGATLVPTQLAAQGVVCSPDASKNPAAELFHHMRAGQPFIFAPSSQPDRVIGAACLAAKSFAGSPTQGPVRVFSWSSANGWIELYPEDARPIARGQDGKTLPHAEAASGTRIDWNDAALIKELYGEQQAGVVIDKLNPVESLKAIARFEIGKDAQGPGRAVFVMSGMGPHLKLSLNEDGRLFQQLKDMRGGLTSDDSQAHVIFNDTPALMPTQAREVGSTFTIQLPRRDGMESLAFASLWNYLFTKVPDGTPEISVGDVTAPEVAAFRKVVGANVRDEVIKQAIADGVTVDQLTAFLPPKKSLPDIAEQLVGFTYEQAKDLLGEAISRGDESGRIDFQFISKRRFDMLKENFFIELVQPDPNMPVPMGLDVAIRELQLLKTVFEQGDNRKKAIAVPPLVLFAGVPGMGKSLIAKYAATLMDKPLIKLDLAKLFNKFVGESESNFARMFQVLESLAPCVVWLDEIEKALGGTAEGATATDGGVAQRTHGLFLTWLEERKDKILMLGTCNEPQKLSAALVSRAPLKFFVGYADGEALAEIWKSNLDAKTDKHSLTAKDIAQLVKAHPALSGREVAQRIEAARKVALSRDPKAPEDITLEHIQAALQGYRSDFEKDPQRAQAIIAAGAAYESASGRPIFMPPTEGTPIEPSKPSATGTSSAAKAGRGRGFDEKLS
jgi:AAA+ superfamily predicted ATPase